VPEATVSVKVNSEPSIVYADVSCLIPSMKTKADAALGGTRSNDIDIAVPSPLKLLDGNDV
jgi:hypothetical protein